MKDSIKKTLKSIDKKAGTHLFESGVKLANKWDTMEALNSLRRFFCFWAVKCGIKRSKKPLKLHLGCGNKKFEGYVNIDHRKTKATDLICDIRKLPYPEGSADSIETYHVIEHLSKQDLAKALKEWFRVLTPGGKLIIECPNFDKAVEEYVEGNKDRIDNIFGRQRFPGDTHLAGYNFETLKEHLMEAGFTGVVEAQPRDSHTEEEPCLRIESEKTSD